MSLHKNKKILSFLGKGIMVVVALVGFIYLNHHAIGNRVIEEWAMHFGYGGILFASIISGFNVIIPIPIIGLYPFFISAGFAPFPLIVTISVGMLLGDMLGYGIGYVGRNMVLVQKRERKILHILQQIETKYHWGPIVFLFLFASLAPLPNELVVVPMAFMGYRLRYMAIALFFGNILFNSLGAFGILSIVAG